MKLIDDPDFFEIQNKWFLTQLKKTTGVYAFINIAKAELLFKELYGGGYVDLSGSELQQMRDALTNKGLTLLSNAIAAHKKRIKKRSAVGFTKKLQADIDTNTLDKLNAYCNAQNKDQAAVLTELINTLSEA